MIFRDVIARPEALDYLREITQHDHVPHALLFWGPEGTGKLATALAFSQYLLCAQPDGDACGGCKHCIKSAKLIHPDIHFMFPTTGAKVRSTDLYPEWREAVLSNPYLNFYQWLQAIRADRKQGNINTADCQRVIEQLGLKAFEATHKVLVIWMAEFLGKEGNRLLKLIEEPPENTVILLICEQREKILPTILSRCQQVHFKPLPDQTISTHLERLHKLPREQAMAIALSANGSWNEAVTIATNAGEAPVEKFTHWARTAYRGRPEEMAENAGQLAQMPKEAQKYLLKYGLNLCGMVIRARYGVHQFEQSREAKLMHFLVNTLDPEVIGTLSETLSDAFLAIERNANTKILWMHLTLILRDAVRGKHLSAVK